MSGGGYAELSDEDRRWAANSHDEEIVYRGPCGLFFVWIDHTVDRIREQSPVQNLLLVLAVFFACALGNTLLEDQHVSVVVRGGKACAADHDLLDQENKRCRVEGKLPLAALRGEPWVKCADFTSGAHLLNSMQDEEGRFWYPVTDKHKISFFYSTCNPTCASATDVYKSKVLSCHHGVCDGGMCQVGDYNGLRWLEGKAQSTGFFSSSSALSGVTCSETPRTRPGQTAIKEGTEEVGKHSTLDKGEYYYDPEQAAYVRAMYDACDGPCACNDRYVPSLDRCSITDEAVRIFFDPSRNSPQGMNAYCKQMGGEIRFIKGQGGLQGGWRHMTYDPLAKPHLVKLYKSCAQHIPCP
eukprot:Tamp_17634.p1 GENE.Tamp_17634~~Tamp_17634.p1  ORF type:complete len:377 (-),score=48.48 Tamp_17634:248-1309(-)